MRTPATLPYLFALLPLCGMAQDAVLSWGDPIDVNAQSTGALRPRIVINGEGEPVVLWGRSGPNANYVAVGEGDAFGPAIQVSGTGFAPSVADWMGSGIAAHGNTVWVAMSAIPEESRPQYVRRSDDGGNTWGDTLRVDPYDGLVSRFPSIALPHPDTPVVQYMQFTSGWNEPRHVVARLEGPSFAAPVQVSTPFSGGEACDCCPGQVVAEGDRAVSLYRNDVDHQRNIWAAASVDGGLSFPVGALVDGNAWILDACPASGPAGYIVGDSIRHVWMSGANNGFKVYLGSAHVAGLATGTQRLVHPGQSSGLTQNFPRIAGSGDTLGVVWEQISVGAREILFSWSVTGPGGLSVPDTVNVSLTGNQRTPDVAFADGAFHIIWSEMPTNQVRYRKATLEPFTGITESPMEEVRLWPDPATEWIHWSGQRWRTIEVFDGNGRMVRSGDALQGMMDVRGLPAGAYFVLLHGTDRSARTRFMKQ